MAGFNSILNISTKRIGVTLYTLGAITCIAIWAVLVWGDFEASLFANVLPTEKHLSTLSCPVVVAKNEVGTISAKFNNPTDRKLSTNVRTYISQGYMSLIEESDTPLKLEPDEDKTLEWQVDANSAVWNRLIMVRVYSFRQYPYPSYTSTCGILVIGRLPFSGDTLFFGTLIFSVLALISGAYIIWQQKKQFTQPRTGIFASIIALVIIVLLGLAVGLLGNWVTSLLLLLLAILLLIVALANRIMEI